jgi:hypothetical protein
MKKLIQGSFWLIVANDLERPSFRNNKAELIEKETNMFKLKHNNKKKGGESNEHKH